MDKLVDEVRQFHSRDFLNAAMAVCALTAAADDEVVQAEYQQVDKALATIPALQELDSETATKTLYEYVYDLRSYGAAAAERLHGKVRRLAGNHKRARTLMRVAYLVIIADGKIRQREKEEFQRLCSLLGLEPHQVWRELAA